MAEASKCDRRCGLYNPPPGYLAAHEWAERMMQAHEQRLCPGCGLWTIWVRRRSPRSAVPDRVADVPTGGPQVSDTCAGPDREKPGGAT